MARFHRLNPRTRPHDATRRTTRSDAKGTNPTGEQTPSNSIPQSTFYNF